MGSFLSLNEPALSANVFTNYFDTITTNCYLARKKLHSQTHSPTAQHALQRQARMRDTPVRRAYPGTHEEELAQIQMAMQASLADCGAPPHPTSPPAHGPQSAHSRSSSPTPGPAGNVATTAAGDDGRGQ